MRGADIGCVVVRTSRGISEQGIIYPVRSGRGNSCAHLSQFLPTTIWCFVQPIDCSSSPRFQLLDHATESVLVDYGVRIKFLNAISYLTMCSERSCRRVGRTFIAA